MASMIRRWKIIMQESDKQSISNKSDKAIKLLASHLGFSLLYRAYLKNMSYETD